MATENNSMDLQEVVKRAVKYLIEGGAVELAAFTVNQSRRNNHRLILGCWAVKNLLASRGTVAKWKPPVYTFFHSIEKRLHAHQKRLGYALNLNKRGIYENQKDY